MVSGREASRYARKPAGDLDQPLAAARRTTPTDWAGTRGFVGGTKDATGLTHIGAREYDPVLQRFTTVDPIMVLEDPCSGTRTPTPRTARLPSATRQV